ncbi:hypothetical protein AWZ03_015510 [Drosophila navojoa]|uniref:Reverse transcriptase zinc-binding domain-containing protein n=1 Tax=Drosophila navojoa TaxID=7232 RepID=A0A484AMS9_DRONA|nr:hypothetical protein AWZ03_015510 [Drosophila navojoa]
MLTSFLITGHGSLNAFLHARGLSETAGCLCGNPSEDWQHVLCVCPLYADVRDLDGLRIQQSTSGDWIVAETLMNQDSMELLENYARTIFSRRRTLRHGQPMPDTH